MKKILVLAFFSFLLMGMRVHAQGRFELGVKGGMNLSDVNMTGLSKIDWSSKPNIGVNYGIFGQAKIIDKLSFRTEFYFSNKRYNVTENSGASTEHYTSHLNSWTIPMFLMYDVKSLDKYKFYVFLGPSVSIKVKDDKYDNVRSQDPYWCGVGGLGVKYGMFAADLRYERNFYDFYQYESGDKNRTLNSNVVSLNLSINFLKKRELKK